MGVILDFIQREIIERARVFIGRVKAALAHFFQKALNMMKKVMDKLKGKVRGVIMGASHFLRKRGEKYQEGTRTFSLDQEIGEWVETTVTRNIELEDVPEEYRTMDDEFEINDTKELRDSLEW